MFNLIKVAGTKFDYKIQKFLIDIKTYLKVMLKNIERQR